MGFTLQPLVIVVGPSISEINQYFVLVDDTSYLLNSIITAVDYCFKVIYVLNVEYPKNNLGIHSIIGFVESFFSNYSCWMCKVHKDIIRKQCYVDEELIRHIEDYNLDIIEII